MKKITFGFVIIIFLFVFTPSVLFAQTVTTTPTQHAPPADRTLITPTPSITNTPTSIITQAPTETPPSTPTPTNVTPTPTHITPTPTEKPTEQSISSTTVNTPPSPPPIPPAPQPLTNITASPAHTIPPSVATTIGRYLSVPFAISLHYLPKNVYSEAGLSSRANSVLIFLALMSIGSGTVLLIKPTVMKWAGKQHISFAHNEKRKSEFAIPRIAFS